MYFFEDRQVLVPRVPRYRTVIGMMTRAEFPRGGHKNLRGPIEDGGAIVASMVYYDTPRDFFVVHDYRLARRDLKDLTIPPIRLQSRPSLVMGLNEYKLILGAGSVVNPGFYFASGMHCTLIEDPDNLLCGKILGDDENIPVWVRTNDFDKRVAKFRVSALEDSPYSPDSSQTPVVPREYPSLNGIGFLVNSDTGSVFCREYARQWIYLPKQIAPVGVGEFIIFRADYHVQTRRYVINHWSLCEKQQAVRCRREGDKYIFREKLVNTKLRCSKRVVRGERMSLIKDRGDSIYEWCVENNVDWPSDVHAWVEEDPSPDRCTFFAIHSFDWDAVHWDNRNKRHCAGDADTDPKATWTFLNPMRKKKGGYWRQYQGQQGQQGQSQGQSQGQQGQSQGRQQTVVPSSRGWKAEEA